VDGRFGDNDLCGDKDLRCAGDICRLGISGFDEAPEICLLNGSPEICLENCLLADCGPRAGLICRSNEPLLDLTGLDSDGLLLGIAPEGIEH